jgi:K+-transporting ATPase KdpF subunit
MNLQSIVMLIITVFLMAYLLFALLKPENF